MIADLIRSFSLLQRPHHIPDYKSLNTILGKLVENGLMALLISPIDELTRTFSRLSQAKAVASATPTTVTVASKLQSRKLTATPGQMTTIGTIALQMYEEKYGHRPSKQLEQVGKFKFKTYHYETEAVELIDSAIDLVMRESHSGSNALE